MVEHTEEQTDKAPDICCYDTTFGSPQRCRSLNTRHDQTTDRKWGRHQGSGSASVSYTAWWNKRNKWIIVKEVYLHFEGKHSREEDKKQVWKLEIFFISFQSCGAAEQVFTRRENEIYPRDSMKHGHRINHFKYGWRWSLLMLIKSNPSESISKIIAASAC